MDKKALVFGVGRTFEENKERICELYDIVGFIDNDVNKQNKAYIVNGEQKQICNTAKIDVEYDEILICTFIPINFFDIYSQLLNMGIPFQKIKGYPNAKMFINERGMIFTNDFGIVAQLTDKSDCIVWTELNSSYKEIEGLVNCVLIDIGMNVGMVSMFYASKNYIDKVYGYEPFASTYEKALNNFSLNKKEITEKINHYNYGLGYCNEERFVKSLRLDWSGGNSTVISDNVSTTDKSGTPVMIKNAADEIKRVIIGNPNKKIICKIDTEGSEYEIFKILTENDIVNKIDVFIIEYHGSHNQDYIKQVLHNNSFSMVLVPDSNFLGIGMITAINNNLYKSVCFSSEKINIHKGVK